MPKADPEINFPSMYNAAANSSLEDGILLSPRHAPPRREVDTPEAVAYMVQSEGSHFKVLLGMALSLLIIDVIAITAIIFICRGKDILPPTGPVSLGTTEEYLRKQRKKEAKQELRHRRRLARKKREAEEERERQARLEEQEEQAGAERRGGRRPRRAIHAQGGGGLHGGPGQQREPRQRQRGTESAEVAETQAYVQGRVVCGGRAITVTRPFFRFFSSARLSRDDGKFPSRAYFCFVRPSAWILPGALKSIIPLCKPVFGTTTRKGMVRAFGVSSKQSAESFASLACYDIAFFVKKSCRRCLAFYRSLHFYWRRLTESDHR